MDIWGVIVAVAGGLFMAVPTSLLLAVVLIRQEARRDRNGA